ncbi:hypothetical protein WJX79_004843 [Trebouxia sp. C0005]
MNPSTADDFKQQQYQIADWALVNSCLSSECEGVQWKGARILYLKLAQDPKSIVDFAEQLGCLSCISKITHMLDNPNTDPISIFAPHFSARQIGRPTSMLQDHLKILQQTPLPIGNLIDAANMAQRDRIMRRCVSQDVKSSPYAKHYVGQLQHAGLSLFTPYGSRQSSNCLFWLCEEPESDAEPSAPPWDGRDGSDIDEGLNNPDDAEQTPEAINGLSGRSENLSGHTFGDLQNVATEEQRQGRAEDLGGPGCWTTGRVVLLSATAFSAKICVTALESMVDKWAEERRLESLQARGDEMTAGRSR